METEPARGTAEGRYRSLLVTRNPFYAAAEKAAKLTIPSLLPPEGHAAGMQLYMPYQSVGARGINHLSAKLVLALFPPNAPFFKLDVTAEIKADLAEREDDVRTALEQKLAQYERVLLEDIESSGDRVVLSEALKQLLVTGNVLLYISREGSRLFTIDRYVVRRSPMGEPVEIVVRESFAREALPPEARDFMLANGLLREAPDFDDDSFDIYTHLRRDGATWTVYQEVQGLRLPGSEGTYPRDKSPWLPLRLIKVDGEDYGRSYVTEYIGDLHTLEALSQAIVEASVAGARVLFLVKPNSLTRERDLATAPNAAIVTGDANDVSVIQMQKFSDLRVARETMDTIENRLQFAFLLHSAIQRSGERVTAEEIRVMAQELEDGLGGIYSLLTQELQLPYVRVRQGMLARTGKLPTLPKDAVKFTIVTGLQALGRGHDKTKLINYLSTIGQLFGEQALARLNMREALERLALAEGVDTLRLLIPEEMFQQMQAQQQQQQQAMAMMEQLGPEALRQMGGAAQQMQGNPNG